MEVWKDVTGFEGLYEVSSYGNLRSVDRDILCNGGYYKHFNGKTIKTKLNKYGYPSAGLWYKGKRTDVVIHRLVAEAFIDNQNNYEQINHIDGNKTNNHVENLEWCDNNYNMKHAKENGLLAHQKGEKHGGHKLTNEQVREIRRLRNEGWKYRQLAEKFGVCDRTIGQICRNEYWTHLL